MSDSEHFIELMLLYDTTDSKSLIAAMKEDIKIISKELNRSGDQTYDWVNIKNCGLPPAGEWYDAFTYDYDGDRVVETLFFDGVNDTGVHWLLHGDWLEPVTHYKTHYTVSPPEGDEL